MFNRDSILKNLNTENYYIDKHSLDLFLDDWKIESIYEDEDGLEFYDDLAVEKIKKGISLKAQGYNDEQIISKLSKIEARVESYEEPRKQVQPLLVSEMPEVKEKNKDAETVENKPTKIVPPQEIYQPEPKNQEITPVQNKSFTLDVSSQTLQMLAEAVAKKISDDITNSDMAAKLVEAGGYKRDNEILARQVKELLEHNRELSQRIELLESKTSKTFWERFLRK